MAIVFISPKERQKVFILGIAGFFALLLILIGLRVFLVKPKPTPPEQVFKAPKIGINFDILNSAQVKNLEPLAEIDKQFSYEGMTAKGQKQTGKISAVSEQKAAEILTALGLSDVKLEEIKGGRENPFTPFYEIQPAKKTKKK